MQAPDDGEVQPPDDVGDTSTRAQAGEDAEGAGPMEVESPPEAPDAMPSSEQDRAGRPRFTVTRVPATASLLGLQYEGDPDAAYSDESADLGGLGRTYGAGAAQGSTTNTFIAFTAHFFVCLLPYSFQYCCSLCTMFHRLLLSKARRGGPQV